MCRTGLKWFIYSLIFFHIPVHETGFLGVTESLSVICAGVPITLEYFARRCCKHGKTNSPWHHQTRWLLDQCFGGSGQTQTAGVKLTVGCTYLNVLAIDPEEHYRLSSWERTWTDSSKTVSGNYACENSFASFAWMRCGVWGRGRKWTHGVCPCI